MWACVWCGIFTGCSSTATAGNRADNGGSSGQDGGEDHTRVVRHHHEEQEEEEHSGDDNGYHALEKARSATRDKEVALGECMVVGVPREGKEGIGVC